MKASRIRVSLGFANGTPDNTLITFARHVLALIYTVPGLPTIPITAAALTAAIDAFAEASNNNLVLLSTGFEAVRQNRAQYPLSKPTIERMIPGMTGTMRVTLTREKVARV